MKPDLQRPVLNARPPRSKTPRRIVFVVCAVLVVIPLIKDGLAAHGGGLDSAAAAQISKPVVNTTGLQSSLDAIRGKYPYNTSVAVVDLNSGATVQSGDDAAFVAASTTKLITASYYLSQVEKPALAWTLKLLAKRPDSNCN